MSHDGVSVVSISFFGLKSGSAQCTMLCIKIVHRELEIQSIVEYSTDKAT